MIDKVIENNRVSIIGEIVSEFKFSHEVFGEGFYTVDVSVDRLSELTDVIPLMVSERLVDVSEDYQGRLVEVSGQFRSYNRHEGAKNKLVLSIFLILPFMIFRVVFENSHISSNFFFNDSSITISCLIIFTIATILSFIG